MALTYPETGLPDAGGELVPGVIENLMKWVLILLGSFAVIGFAVSGILYLTSAGNQERMETAKKGMIYSIIGVMVGLSGLIIITAINSWFSGDTDF